MIKHCSKVVLFIFTLIWIGSNNAISEILTVPELRPFAGDLSGRGDDGAGLTARFTYPRGVALDKAGNLYVTDTGENRYPGDSNSTIRKITPSGIVSTFAGAAGELGSEDGIGPSARFNHPQGVAVDNAGYVYVSDSRNHTIRKISPEGVVSTLAGIAGQSGFKDGAGIEAQFYYPGGLAIDRSANLYVADALNHVIRKITPDGVVSTFAGLAGEYNIVDGVGKAARFKHPEEITIDSEGNLFVVDGSSIRKISPSAAVSTFIREDAGVYASGIAIDRSGTLYISNHTSAISKIISTGEISTLAGTMIDYHSLGLIDGTGAAAKFDQPGGLVVDSEGNIFVADSANNAIRKITPQGEVSKFAGRESNFGYMDGEGARARFDSPSALATDSSGNVFVVDSGRILRKITPAGVVSTLDNGNWNHSNVTDSRGGARSFNILTGVATSLTGDVYVTDCEAPNREAGGGYYFWPRFFVDKSYSAVRKISARGFVSTVVDKTGNLQHPQGIATDSVGNIYITDSSDNTIRKIIRRTLFSDIVKVFAGSVGKRGSIDGVGTEARLSSPDGIALDRAGNIYVADTGNHTIRKITREGVVTALAGKAGVQGSSDGVGEAARFDNPRGIATDRNGNVYVADYNNHVIRKINAEGVVTTLVGISGQKGFAPGVLPGTIEFPLGVAVYGTSLYISTRNGVAVVNNIP